MSHKRCAVCIHADAGAINSTIEAGLQLKEIAARFGVSKYALSRHHNRCLAPAPVVGADPTDRIEVWLSRANDLYIQSGVNGDVKSQIAALSAAVRSLQAEQRREKKQEQHENQAVGADSVEELDAIITKYLESCGNSKCFHCGAPCHHGIYMGPAMPDTFPSLTGRGHEQEPS